ncbi:MAG: hypothetical protein K6G17_04250 [Oscillospiraceae bacterium]|nr:hypothetical protein [Oscillospiraceae bacterium]
MLREFWKKIRESWKKIDLRRVLLYALYLFLTLVFQNMVLTQIRPLGVCPFVLPAAVVAAGMFEGGVWGAVFGLVMGVYADMAFIESTVGFTLLFPALAFAAGFVTHFFLNRRFFGYMVTAAVALLVTAALQMLRVLLAEGWDASMLSTVLLQTLWSLPPAALVWLPPARWMR